MESPEKPRRVLPPTAVEALHFLKEEDARTGLEKWDNEITIGNEKKEKETLQHEKEQLTKELESDHLTQLKPRRLFDKELEHDLSLVRGEVKEYRKGVKPLEEVVLVMVDLDKFKVINDTYGHPGGDEVLRKVSEVLLESVRPTDTVARYGGEELAIIMRNIKADVAALHIEDIRSKIERLTFNGEYSKLKVTASFGLASSKSLTDPTPEALLKEADAKLYEAKNSGRNNVKF